MSKRILSTLAASIGLMAATQAQRPIARGRHRTVDAQSFDAATVDSTGVFFSNELIRVDTQLIQPMSDFPYTRDIDIIPIDIGDEATAYDALRYTATGGVNPAGKSFISARTTAIGTVGIDSERTTSPVNLWGEVIQYSVIEIARAAKLGRPIDPMMGDSLRMKWNVDNQNQVMLGDTATGAFGLVNLPSVTAAAVPNGAAASPLWANKTDAEILADVNNMLTAAWTASGFTKVPNKLGLAPTVFAYLVGRPVGTSGIKSMIEYLKENNIATANGTPLQIVPMRELTGAGAGGTNRAIAYTQARDVVRFPRSTLENTPVQFDGLFQKTVYYAKVGVVEVPKPQLLIYRDGM